MVPVIAFRVTCPIVNDKIQNSLLLQNALSWKATGAAVQELLIVTLIAY